MSLGSHEIGSIIDRALYKNDALKRIVSDDIASGRFVHASIIEGPPKSGKLTLARAIAAELSMDASAADRIMRGISADVYEIAPKIGRKTIGIDEIKEIRETAFIVPNDSDIKAYIIRYASTMTVKAQNAILKLLEEPPKNVYFMLLVENAATLLPTVRSRAPVLRMQVFTAEEIMQYLDENSPRAREMSRNAPDDLARIVARSCGSIGEALRMVGDGDNSQALGAQVVEFLRVLTDKDRAALSVFPIAAKNREELSEFLSMLRTALRDMTAIRSRGKCEMLFGDDETLAELSKKVGMATLLRAELTVANIVEQLEKNLSIANIKSEMTISLWRAFSE